MDFSWSQPQAELNKRVAEFARAELGSDLINRDHGQIFDAAGWRRCGEMGLTGLPVPTEYGGGAYDPLSMVAALEGLGYGCKDNGLNFAIGAHLWGCVTPLLLFGNAQQKHHFLPRLCSGEWIGALAATELNAGSDIYSMNTQAVPTPYGYRLTGQKIMITNAPLADVIIVLARLGDTADSKKLCAFAVERHTDGLHIGASVEKMGLRTALMGTVTLDNCLIPAENLLGKAGNGMVVFSQAMEWERSLILAPALGTMQRQLADCRERARSRQQFGQAIGKFQRVADKIVDMHMALETSRALIYKFAWLKSQNRTALLESSVAKLHTSEAWIETSQAALQIFGGLGYLTKGEVERDLRDALGSRIYSGTSDIQRQIISQWL